MTVSIDNNTLLINLIGIDQRNRNAIEMVLNKKKSDLCAITNAEEAPVSIVDLDKYGAADEWEALLQIKPEQFAIFLSVDETRQNSSYFFLKKPVSINDFLNVLTEARNKLGFDIFSSLGKQSSLSKLFSPRLKYSANDLTRVARPQDSEENSKEIVFFI